MNLGDWAFLEYNNFFNFPWQFNCRDGFDSICLRGLGLILRECDCYIPQMMAKFLSNIFKLESGRWYSHAVEIEIIHGGIKPVIIIDCYGNIWQIADLSLCMARCFSSPPS